jgi:hypothetical protein
VVVAPGRQEPQGALAEEPQPPQNNDHNNNLSEEEENNEEEKEEGNKAEGEEDEDYTPWSNTGKDETFHDADEIKTFGDEAPIPIGRLRDLLNHIKITLRQSSKSREFHALAEKSTRQSWRSSANPMCSADTRAQHSGPLTRMQ